RSGSRTAGQRNDSLTKTHRSTPEATPRSAQARARPALEDPVRSGEEDPLDHLPPLDLPGEVTRSATPPPAPPTARPEAKPRKETRNDSIRRGENAPAEPHLSLTVSPDPAPETASAAGARQGIARFASVDSRLAGGSAPSGAGLSWLAEKGY